MDKKLKKAGGKITMPNDMKERIIKACETAEKNRLTHVDSDDGYTEVVSGTERITSRNRIVRTVGAVAACAVLMAGIGTTGFLLHKQSNKMAGSEIVGETNNPFGDFSTFEYSFDAGDGKYGKYSAETYARLSEFLNKFNWGEPVERPEGRDKDTDVEEPVYDIKWTRGNTPPIECDLHIANDGYVSYQESMMSFETGGQMPLTENSKWYKIDFETFNSGVKEILAQRDDAPTPFGDFSTLPFRFRTDDGKYGTYSDEIHAKLADFLNTIDWGEKLEGYEPPADAYDVEGKTFNISWFEGNRNVFIHIKNDGLVTYYVMQPSEDIYKNSLDMVETRYFKIDFDAFDRGVQEIITLDSAQSEPDTLYPFGNFEDFEFSLINVDGNIVEYSPELYAELANFLNTFDWGERHEFGDSDEPTYLRLKDVKMYHINWEYEYDNGYATVTQKRTIQVMGGNKAFYYCYEPISNSNEMHCVDREWHEIDFAAFDRGVKEILAKYQAEAPTEAIESAELFYGDHEKLTSANEESMAKLDAFLKNDFIKMLEPTLSDDIVGGRKYYVEYYFKSDGNKKRRETYYIYMDGFVDRRMYVADENGEWQSAGDESYQIDMAKLESVLKDDIGVELPEFAEININKVD